jgi:hypothetical protein
MERFPAVLRDPSELRALYRDPAAIIQQKKVSRLGHLTRRFIAGSPFCLIATADADGNCDVSPRGGPPGFVRVLDDTALAIPDLVGNNLLDSLTNILANPHAVLLFVIPGRDDTLRVEGRACLTTDEELLGLWDSELRRPRLAIAIEVNTVYPHCAKSFRRGRVWEPTSWSELDAPDTCEIAIDDLGLNVPVADVRAYTEAENARELADEKVHRDA